MLSRCKDPLEREFYLRSTACFGWTKAVLQHQIDNKTYEKYLLNQTNFDQTLTAELQAQAALPVLLRKTHEAKLRGDKELMVWGDGYTTARVFVCG